MVNEHEKYINQINMKLKELNMFEIFSTDGENKEEKNEGNNLIEKLESINSKIKLNSEKMTKLDESNFKLMESWSQTIFEEIPPIFPLNNKQITQKISLFDKNNSSTNNNSSNLNKINNKVDYFLNSLFWINL